MGKVKKEFEYEFDPIKEEIGGEKVKAIIWTTKALNKAVEGIKKGLPLKTNPFIGKQTNLLRPELVYKRTPEEVEEYKRCMVDPVYFAKYCKLMTTKGLQYVTLRDYQVDYLHHLQDHNFSIFLSCRQSGKCFNLLTFITIKVNKNNKNIAKLKEKYLYYSEDNFIYIDIPIFELYHLLDKSFIGNIRYLLYKSFFKFKLFHNLISLLDRFDYKFIHDKLTDGYKTIQEIEINDIEIKTDTGYKPITNFLLTKPFDQYTITVENGYSLICADRHILFDEYLNEIFCEDLHIGDKIMTDEGPQKIISISKDNTKVMMCDISVDDDNHRFYSNGILSHNSTTTAIFCLWVMVFNFDKAALILSKSGPAGIDLLNKIKQMFLNLPYFLKPGIYKWNQHEISFDNNCKIATEAFSPTAGLGQTINFLILDEFAWTPPNETELFYMNVIPTVTTMPDAKVCIMSTQNGFNFFYELWRGAILHESDYAPFKVDWDQVPDFDPVTETWVKRTDEWKKMMIGRLGSEERFYYQYGTQFSSSNYCLINRDKMAVIRNASYNFENVEIPGLFILHPENLYFDPNFDISLLRTGYFIILVDLAEGGGNDYTVFNIIQILNEGKTLQQVGYWRSNEINIELAGLEFWLLIVQLFNDGKTLISIEWNTYGALFYKILASLNEFDSNPELSFRFNVNSSGDDCTLDMNNIIHYKKEVIEVNNNIKKSQKYEYGIRLNKNNKATGCTMLKMYIENDTIKIFDILTITEIENFEDKNGNGSYEASFGHDDVVMTFVQIPFVINTLNYKNLIEDMALNTVQTKIDNQISSTIYDNDFKFSGSINTMYDF